MAKSSAAPVVEARPARCPHCQSPLDVRRAALATGEIVGTRTTLRPVPRTDPPEGEDTPPRAKAKAKVKLGTTPAEDWAAAKADKGKRK